MSQIPASTQPQTTAGSRSKRLDWICWSPLAIYTIGTVFWPGFFGLWFFFLLSAGAALAVVIYAIVSQARTGIDPAWPCTVSGFCVAMGFAGFLTHWPVAAVVMASDGKLSQVWDDAKRGHTSKQFMLAGVVPIREVRLDRGEPVIFLYDGNACLTRNQASPGAQYEPVAMPNGWTLWIED
ncbi:MAG: hypothetical protein HONBIEJF_00882 [Fimbriimonadaceae bacterium]|nr:hypothetical protein [Fimbriimonadaceae bacterium]